MGESHEDTSVRNLWTDVHLQASEREDLQSHMRVQVGMGQSSWWYAEPDVGRVATGVTKRVDRLKALGNGQVPLQAALAWRILTA